MVIMSLSACSKIKSAMDESSNVNYQNNQEIKKLEVPPDLTKPEFDEAFELPTGTISAVSLQNGTAMPKSVGVSSTQNSVNSGASRRGDLSSIKTISGKTLLQVNDTYPRSLVLTEIMLVRMGFSIISKSATGNVITAKYNGSDVTIDGKKIGFLNKAKSLVGLSGNDNKALINGQSYKFRVQDQQPSPLISVSQASGKVLSEAAHTKIVTLLNTAFNS